MDEQEGGCGGRIYLKQQFGAEEHASRLRTQYYRGDGGLTFMTLLEARGGMTLEPIELADERSAGLEWGGGQLWMDAGLVPELIKKAAKQERLLAITKPGVVKVVRKEAEKIGINTERITSAKEGEKFKKAQDVELNVLNKERNEKLKKSLKLRKHKYENYMWTIGNRLKPKEITYVNIHPHTKPVVVTVYRSTDRRTFERYKRIKKIPGELRIQSALLAPILKQASSKPSGRKGKHMELEPKIKVPGLECNRSLPEGVPFVNNIFIEEPEYGIFFTDVFGDQAFQRWNDIHQVGIETLVSYLVMDSMIKTLKNA
ncbi:hypothetical protein Tco_0087564 [Tanacetum coccineum]